MSQDPPATPAAALAAELGQLAGHARVFVNVLGSQFKIIGSFVSTTGDVVLVADVPPRAPEATPPRPSDSTIVRVLAGGECTPAERAAVDDLVDRIIDHG